MSTISPKSREYWLIGFIAAYIVGNTSIYLILRYIMKIDLKYIYLTPWLFLTVPICGIIIIVRGRLCDPLYTHRDVVRIACALYIITYCILIYVYLINVYPNLF